MDRKTIILTVHINIILKVEKNNYTINIILKVEYSVIQFSSA